MNTRIAPYLLSAGLLFLSCGRQATSDVAASATAAAIERVVNEVTITSGTPVSTADLRIDGMSCEMMCGGSIKKALAKLPGVEGTEIVFNEGDAADHAIVTFDPAQVDDSELIDAVHALHDGQYKVLAVTITRQVKAATGSTEGAKGENGSEAGAVSVYVPAAVLLPSVITLLTRILRH